jgi:uncharacterized protein YegL
MTNPDYRHYFLIIDHSGSMKKIKDDTEGGIRQFIQDQAALPGKGTISLYEFDTEHDCVFDFADIKTAPEYTLRPRGGTALLDAIGFAVTREGEKLAAMPEDERPGTVVLLIATDGDENSSREYTKPQVKALLTEQQEKYAWAVSYIGANVDAFSVAQGIGLAANSAMDYAANTAGTAGAYAAASAASLRLVKGRAAGQSISFAYTDEERAGAAGGGGGNTPA